MLTRLAYRIHTTLERYLPEQRLFLKSDDTTRFVRLRSSTQAIAVAMGSFAVAWTIVATAVLMMDTIGAGSSREQSQRQQALYEERLNALSADRDLRATEAAGAQERFNIALAQVSDMQGRLLASEDRRRELETGIDVIQNTLRRTIKERDESRSETSRVTAALTQKSGGATEVGRARDALATLDVLTGALGTTALERDRMEDVATAARADAQVVMDEKKALEARNDAIFAQLEEAVTVSMEPLDKMFREAGLSPDDLISAVRKGYSGQGGPLTPVSLSTKGSPSPLTPDELRANAILGRLDQMNIYRMAAFKAPFGMPLKSAYRLTSNFGNRQDPSGRGTKFHRGLDMANDYGTPIYATADGVVSFAGWDGAYGRVVRIKHGFGIETVYAHQSQLRVEVGQRVSRGDRIGDMGSSGRSTGNHLHYEVNVGGKVTNPMTFIKAATDVF